MECMTQNSVVSPSPSPVPVADLLSTVTTAALRREAITREQALAVLATSDDDLLDVVAAVSRVRREFFGRRVKLNYLVNMKSGLCPVEVCVCLGLLAPGQAERLREAGADAYNHNLNTSEATYADICSTHTFDDRVATVKTASAAGLSPCSGAIFGMGEGDEDIVDVAFALRDLDPDSVPVNFLIPFDGTPLEGRWDLTPQRCLRILAVFRLVFPDVEVRLAGGREIHLRTLQPLALHLVNAIFLGDYLTSEGQAGADDLRMIADAGFTVEGRAEQTLPEARHEQVRVRRRGAGTQLPANA